MAIRVHCPYCHQQLQELSQNCHHCGSGLPVGVFSALAVAHGAIPTPATSSSGVPPHLARALQAAIDGPNATTPRHQSALRPWLAVALSCFCGLGQLYNGQIRKGFILLLLGGLAVFAWRFPIGKVLVPCLWLYAMVDAYLVARRPVAPFLR